MSIRLLTLRGALLALAASGAWLLPAAPASALTCSTTTTAVTASFGTVDTLSANNTDIAITITATCTNQGQNDQGTTVNVCYQLNAGSGTGSSIANRKLNSGANVLDYNAYINSARTTIWGNTNAALLQLPRVSTPGTNNGSVSTSTTAYFRLPGGQSTAPAGTYTSTLTGTGRVRTGNNTCNTTNGTALTANPTISVTATVANSCLAITAPAPLAFGTQAGIIRNNIDAATSIAVRCTNGAPYKLGLNAGTGVGATTTTRKLTRSAPPLSTIDYRIFQDAARSQNWGDDRTNGTDTFNGTGSGAAQTINIYGRVPPQSTPQAGSYSDTVTATLAF